MKGRQQRGAKQRLPPASARSAHGGRAIGSPTLAAIGRGAKLLDCLLGASTAPCSGTQRIAGD